MVFLGNIIITAAWMLMAERTRNVHVIHFSAKAVIRADLLFTLPGVLLVLMNGFAMVFDRWGGRDAIYPLSWISAALWLFTASGVVWVGFLIPAQHRIVVFSDPLDYPNSQAIRILLSAPQVVLLGGACNSLTDLLALPDGQQASLRLGR